MGKKFSSISDQLKEFIKDQKIYFVGTAGNEGRVNISPKGMDSLVVLNSNRVIWLNVTGSGNETAAHIQENPRMTIMFAAFSGEPIILRLYGDAKAVHRNDPEWDELYQSFSPLPGTRQIFDLAVDLVQISCGMSVPFYNYMEDRNQLSEWAEKKGEEGIKEYWRDRNQMSLDGKPTNIMDKNA
ncbi:FIG01023442: hypothetical protein [hydrothermal vent metagenome]|uniref:Pyridoxamine 5'-phosphate oxidase N-terminal domain-containing protein n=1 Tax=hydrothermal vent metagenome TaxID=652676 RepID=A0A3B0WCR6_9ZZZZ